MLQPWPPGKSWGPLGPALEGVRLPSHQHKKPTPFSGLPSGPPRRGGSSGGPFPWADGALWLMSSIAGWRRGSWHVGAGEQVGSFEPAPRILLEVSPYISLHRKL